MASCLWFWCSLEGRGREERSRAQADPIPRGTDSLVFLRALDGVCEPWPGRDGLPREMTLPVSLKTALRKSLL